MNQIKKVFFLFVVTLYVVTSCSVNSNVMFKEAREEIENATPVDSIPLHPYSAYRIAPDDKLTFRIITNDGVDLVEKQVGLSDVQVNSGNLEYLVRQDSIVKIPIIGEVKVAGLTINECEDKIAELYSENYSNPFVQLKISNQRVVVFPGNGSDAKVIKLENSNTTLMEVIALAGGITERGKANSIKIMRKVNGVREVYEVDLSTLDGLKFADMIMQGNDYVYVEPTPELAKEITKDVLPIVSLISTAFFVFATILALK